MGQGSVLSRALALAALVVALAAVPAASAPAPPPLLLPSSCPSATDPAKFDSTADLLAPNQRMQDYGGGPTGGAAQNEFVDWIESQLGAMPGMQIDSIPYTGNRWAEQGASLSAGADT